MNLTIAIIGVVVTVAAAAAATGSWMAARKANDTAAVLARIERDRRHAELTPEFDIVCTSGMNGIDGHGELWLALIGPPDVDGLDEVIVTILDEAGANHWARGLPTGVTEEAAQLFVWGPWEFNAGASAQVADNRTTKPRTYSRADGGNWDRLALVRTRPGHWMSMSTEQWQRERVGQSMRLQIACQRAEERWVLLREIKPRTS